MNTPENRVFAISDLHLFPDSNYNYVIDDRWPKKKLPYDPITMYKSWADHIAGEMDAYIYYIVDKDFTLGGACDIAIDTIERYADTGDGIDWFLIDLPGSKSKLNLQSISPTEVGTLNKAIYNLHKGTNLNQVSKSLQIINNTKEKDVEQTFSKLKELENIINKTANYNTRFIITEHCWRVMVKWAHTLLHGNRGAHNVKNKDLEEFYAKIFKPKLHDTISQVSLFPNLDISNQYIEYLNASIGEFTDKTRGRGKVNSPITKTGFLDKKAYNTLYPKVNLDEEVELPALNLDEHSIIGKKLVRHLTETTKLFTM